MYLMPANRTHEVVAGIESDCDRYRCGLADSQRAEDAGEEAGTADVIIRYQDRIREVRDQGRNGHKEASIALMSTPVHDRNDSGPGPYSGVKI